MGLSQSSQDKTQSGTSQTNPWTGQSPYLSQGFQTAAGALDKAHGVNSSMPGFVAQYNPQQLAAFQQMLSAGTNPALAQTSAATGGALSSAGTDATRGALSGLAGYHPQSTADVNAAASSYANNPQVDAMVQAATRDAQRAVSEQALPQIARNAAASGNTNSSRTGVAEGIVQRGLADNVADTSAGIRGAAYNTGLNAAVGRAGAMDNSNLGALSALAGNGVNAASTGVNANNAAVGQQAGLFGLAQQGITGQQAAAQAPLTDALQKYQFNTAAPFAGLNNFWNIIGGQNWGGTTNSSGQSTTTNNPSTMAQIGQGVGILGSLF